MKERAPWEECKFVGKTITVGRCYDLIVAQVHAASKLFAKAKKAFLEHFCLEGAFHLQFNAGQALVYKGAPLENDEEQRWDSPYRCLCVGCT
jgi:hypothetical protein